MSFARSEPYLYVYLERSGHLLKRYIYVKDKENKDYNYVCRPNIILCVEVAISKANRQR